MGADNIWSQYGDAVRDAVQDALKTGDFKNFNDVVASAAMEAMKTARTQINQNFAVQNSQEVPPKETYTEKWLRENNERKAAQREQAVRNLPVRASLAPMERKGSVSGTLFQVFGGIGTGVMAVLSTVFLGLGLGIGGGFWVAFGVLFVFLGLFVGMLKKGNKKKSRLKRALKYLQLAGNNHYIDLEDLALHTNQSEKFVLKDVKRLLIDGFYPEGHLDRQESCLMLDNRIYDEYLTLEKQRKAQEQEMRALPERPVAEMPAQGTASEVDRLISEGQEYIRRLRDMNDNIAGESISAKLFRLENLLKEIFDRLREHPEQVSQMQKFMSYYLPTTLKLVAAYEDFDSLSEQGEDIREAKAEIEKTLDTINSAFSELLNRLFRETAYDVTTDAQVLQTMLAKEGLTREPELEFVKR
mgnify:CR=1 FL=1